jgi:aryl-alcohol dehydrogenase-like predicted oxidoreductase
MWGGTDEADSIAAIHAALDAGIDLVDTAPIYGFGLSEEIVGKAIRDRRDRVVLATKCSLVPDPRGGTFKFPSTAGGPDENGHIVVHANLTPASIRREVEDSLRRLQTDCIDLYQTHRPDENTPISDTMGVLLDLKKEGKIRAIGASNVGVAQMDEYRAVGPLDSDQEKYSMLARELEAEQLPYCEKHHIAMLAYSPLGQGLLTGKVGPERKFPPTDLRASHPLFTPESRRQVAAMLAEFQPIADRHGLTLAQLAIAWTVAQSGVSHALCGARNPKQAQENAAAGDVELSQDELKAMNEAIKNHLVH